MTNDNTGKDAEIIASTAAPTEGSAPIEAAAAQAEGSAPIEAAAQAEIAAFVPPSQETLPTEAKKWNWAAFSLSIWWGIGNKVYLPLLCLIPFFGVVWIFVCGVKGNEWAWKSGTFNSIEEFKKTQETWNRGGLCYFIISAACVALSLILFWGMLFSMLAFYNSMGDLNPSIDTLQQLEHWGLDSYDMFD